MQKTKGGILYSDRELEDYKGRLVSAVLYDGVDTDIVNADPEIKNFISNYVDREVVSRTEEFREKGYVFRLANMVVKGREFLLVNKYKGHDLTETLYFTIDKNNVIGTNLIPYKRPGIIII